MSAALSSSRSEDPRPIEDLSAQPVEEQSAADQVVRRSTLCKSSVWIYFEQTDERDTEGRQKLVCKLCRDADKPAALFRKDSSTSIPRNHLKMHHKSINLQLQSSEQEPELESAEAAEPSNNTPITAARQEKKRKLENVHTPLGGRTRKERALNALLYSLLIGKVPLEFADSDHFRRFLSILSPDYQLIGCDQMTAQVNQLYAVSSDRITKEIRHFALSVTCDPSVSSGCNRCVTVRAHFVDWDWVMRDVTMSQEVATSRHMAEYSMDPLALLSIEYSTSGQSIVARSDIGIHYVNADYQFQSKLRYIIHSLQLYVRNYICSDPALFALLGKGRRLVTKIRTNASLTAVLQEEQKKSNNNQVDIKDQRFDEEELSRNEAVLPEYVVLEDAQKPQPKQSQSSKPTPSSKRTAQEYIRTADIQARFYSICFLFSRLVMLKSELNAVSLSDPQAFNPDEIISTTEFMALEAIAPVLVLLWSVSTTLEASKYPTLSVIGATIHTLYRALIGEWKKPINFSSALVFNFDTLEKIPIAKTFMTRIADELKIRWIDSYTSDYLSNAAILLDPRTHHIRHALGDEILSVCKESLESFLRDFKPSRYFSQEFLDAYDLFIAHEAHSLRIAREKLLRDPSLTQQIKRRTGSFSSIEPPPKRISTNSLEDIMDSVFCDLTKKKSEFEQYLEEKNGADLQDDPFEWWAFNCRRFPTIGLAALCLIPAPGIKAGSDTFLPLRNEVLLPRPIELSSDRIASEGVLSENLAYYDALLNFNHAAALQS